MRGSLASVRVLWTLWTLIRTHARTHKRTHDARYRTQPAPTADGRADGRGRTHVQSPQSPRNGVSESRYPQRPSRKHGQKKRLTASQQWVIALGLLVLLLGLGNLGRAALIPRYAAVLPQLPMTVSWGYLAAVAAFWSVVLTVCAVGLLRFRSWARWSTMAAVTLYEAHVWFNHLRFDASDYARRTRPWDLLLTSLLLILMWGSLNLPAVRSVLSKRTADDGARGPNIDRPREGED